MNYSCEGHRKAMRGLLRLLLVICCWSAHNNCHDFGRGRTAAVADAVVVGGILLPHGDFALDPTFFANETIEREAANEVATGARNAGRWLIELLHQKHHIATTTKPRIIKTLDEKQYSNSLETEDELTIVLLTTPHGIKLDYDYGIYVGSKGTGTATIGGDCTLVRKRSNYSGIRGSVESVSKRFTRLKESTHHCQHKPYNVTLENIDLAPMPLAEDLFTRLRRAKNHPVSGIYSYNDEAPIPLNWGEIIPLLLLPSFATSSKKKSSLLPLIWTFPYRRYNHSIEMIPELLQIGADIMEWAQQRPEKIAVIVSGDLSHTHLPSGPYGYSTASALFDEAIGVWAGGNTNTTENFGRNWDPCRPEAALTLLNRAKELQPDAKSCGFTGYVLWHGMMCSSSTFASESFIEQSSSVEFDSKVLVNRNVTYYGMMGAIFEAKPRSDDGMTEEEQK